MSNKHDKKSSPVSATIGLFLTNKILCLFGVTALVLIGYAWFKFGMTSYLWVLIMIWLVFILLYFFKKALFALNVFFAVFIVLIVFSVLLMSGKVPGLRTDTAGNHPTAGTPASGKDTNAADVLPETTFVGGLGQWYEHVWYKRASSGGEVTTGSDGVTFRAVQPNSRSGIMLDLNKDVSGYSKVTLQATVEVKSQTLTGTGWNGREAPVAIAVSYQDVNGGEHNRLGEDPSAPLQMFWRGFYYLDPASGSGSTNGVKVSRNQPYTFTYDLMTLSPKPKVIRFVGIEGAGWRYREGNVSALRIFAE